MSASQLSGWYMLKRGVRVPNTSTSVVHSRQYDNVVLVANTPLRLSYRLWSEEVQAGAIGEGPARELQTLVCVS
jgi:hypothetical protein